ncbi:hypothetical protein BJY04DRAFT_219772 [Aspergillus karnatakaensis]|uniref:thioesterase domain protein n=1 Tax=Aspergillus karnatakaensis TaxID=1810916 RepID=UPI003CCDB285
MSQQYNSLYPGEVLETISGFPTIYHYQPPANVNPKQPRPLVVCVPGGLHLARIFYGGHKGSNPSDFLSHWLSQHGFAVLSLSYPLETSPDLMPATAAHFRIPNWGLQAATTAKKVIDEHAISSSAVILISWSMGGHMVVPFTIAARDLGLDVQQYIGFAATPGFSSIRSLSRGITCSPSGYLQLPPHMEVFQRQLAKMNEVNGREIISQDVYIREYTGGTPINLIGLGLKYDGQGEFVKDDVPHEEDTKVLDIANLPFITALAPTSILDASHALADRASWGFLLTYKLEAMIGKQGIRNVRDSDRWQQLLHLIHSAPERLCRPVPGNHFFFVGERSAKEAAEELLS